MRNGGWGVPPLPQTPRIPAEPRHWLLPQLLPQLWAAPNAPGTTSTIAAPWRPRPRRVGSLRVPVSPTDPILRQGPTHVSWVPKKKTWYLLEDDFTAASGISSICATERKRRGLGRAQPTGRHPLLSWPPCPRCRLPTQQLPPRGGCPGAWIHLGHRYRLGRAPAAPCRAPSPLPSRRQHRQHPEGMARSGRPKPLSRLAQTH